MFERFHSIIVLSLSLEQRLCITPPSILTLCSFASLFRLLRRSILTAVMLDLRFSHFYLGALLSLPYIVCLFYRWREFGDITIIGSYYGVPIIQRLVHPRSGCLYHPPSILIALSPASPVYSYGDLVTIFSSFYFICSRDFIVGIMILWISI